MGSKIPCEICTTSIFRHSRRYGGKSCNDCAGFFYRTITLKKQYICFAKNECLKVPSLLGKTCRKCRFDKCLEAGMTTPEILAQKKLLKKEENEQKTDMAKKIDAILYVSSLNPYLLEQHFIANDLSLLTYAANIAKENTNSARIAPFTEILAKHLLLFEELPLLCYLCLCKIKIKGLSGTQITKIQMLQKFSFQDFIKKVQKSQRLNEILELVELLLNIFYTFL